MMGNGFSFMTATPQNSYYSLGVSGVGSLGSNAASTISQPTASGWSQAGDFMGGLGSIIGSGAQLWGAYNSFTQGKKQLENQQQQLDLMKYQVATENKRYDEQLAERKENQATSAEAANRYKVMPTQRD